MDLQLSISVPSTDGWSEWGYNTCEQELLAGICRSPSSYLEQVSQSFWACANNVVNASTGYSPFVLNLRETPTLPESLVVSQDSSMDQAVANVLSTMKKALETAQHNLAQAQKRTKQQVDKVGHVEEWKERDQVLFGTGYLCMFTTHLPMKFKQC